MAVPYSFANGRYLVEKTLGVGSMGVVYEVLDIERNMRVALKTLRHMETDSLYYFKKEFRALHDMAHPNLCSLLELFKDDDTWFYTMELIQGLDFLTYVANGTQRPGAPPPSPAGSTEPVSGLGGWNETPHIEQTGSKKPQTPFFDELRLRTALGGLCGGLHALHTAGKVHRDIKPSNVLIDASDRVILLDFGFVTETESSKQTDHHALVGSAAYMAPEQADCGAVGPEADLYAVGVMLYRALTGSLPFSGSPIQILVNKQSSDPVPPSQLVENVPEDLNDLCLALLSRKPASRPNVFEIMGAAKLERPTPLTSDINNLSLANQDTSFVGRDTELKFLKEAYQKTLADSLEIVVIEGVSGVGKSRLLQQFSEMVMSHEPSTIILTGRCYERESAPFKAFDGVMDSLIAHIKKVPAEKTSGLRSPNLYLLADLFPAIKRSGFWKKTQPSMPKIEDPVELQSRSFEAFRDTLTKLRIQHPLVVAIDDMQWADPDSLSFLKQLVSSVEMPPILIILVSRYADDEETSVWDWDKLLSSTFDDESSAWDWGEPTSTPCQKVHLKPLELQDSTTLTEQFIKRERMLSGPDPESIATEAEGHPLYIAELVHHIAQGADQWKSLRIDEVISSRVKNLSKNARFLLRIISVLGVPISREHLEAVSDLNPNEFHDTIRLLRSNNLIRSSGPKRKDLIEAFHDRVREAVVAHDMSIEETTKINLLIGQFYLRTYSEEELEDNIFFVVQHLYEGIDLITDEKERRHLAELFFKAGKKSRQSAAFVSALVYFKESIGLFTKDSWDKHYDTVFALHCAAAESAYITGDFTLTKKLTLEANSRAKSHLDRAKIFEPYMLSLVANDKPLDALDESIGMVRKLGVRLPRHPSKFYLLVRLLVTKLRLFGKRPDKMLNLPRTTNQNIIAARQIIGTIGDIAFLHRPLLWPAILFKLIGLLFKHGVDYNATMTLVGWAALNCIALKNFKDGHKYGSLAVKLLPQFTETTKAPMTLLVFATFVQHWREHLGATIPYLLESNELAYKNGNLLYFGYSGSNICYHLFYIGQALPELADDLQTHGNKIKQKNLEMSSITIQIFLQTTKNLMGQSPDPTKLHGTEYREEEIIPYLMTKSQNLNLFDHYQCKLVLCTYFNSYKLALDAATEIGKFGHAAVGTYAFAIIPFYESLVCLKYHDEADAKTKKQLLRRVRINQRQYKKTAASSPDNHAHKFALVEAERARLSGKAGNAKRLYSKAIEGAIQNGFTQDAALAAEFAAEFYLEMGDRQNTLAAARQALAFYEKWGAWAKVDQVKSKFGLENG